MCLNSRLPKMHKNRKPNHVSESLKIHVGSSDSVSHVCDNACFCFFIRVFITRIKKTPVLEPTKQSPGLLGLIYNWTQSNFPRGFGCEREPRRAWRRRRWRRRWRSFHNDILLTRVPRALQQEEIYYIVKRGDKTSLRTGMSHVSYV